MDIAAEIGRARIVPVLRMARAEAVIDEARRLLDSGLPLVEIAATTPDWFAALSRVRSSHPEAILGIGTITNVADARRAVDGGANFLVCPHLSPEVRAEVGNMLIEGGMTPGEIASAAGHGLAKLFPAHVLGPSYLKSLLAVMPLAKIMPTGGIDLDDAQAWFAAGAHAVGVGSSLASLVDPAKAVHAVLMQLNLP